MFATTYAVQSVRMGVNYGLNKVRFTSPVPVNSRVRAKMRLTQATPIENNGMQLLWSVSIEREGSDKPVCVAESLTRLYE
jgi:acyl dehydratase